MTSAEEQLKYIGFGTRRRDIACWRTTRLDLSVSPTGDRDAPPDPAHSRALARWREVLARSPRLSPYRIRRVAGR